MILRNLPNVASWDNLLWNYSIFISICLLRAESHSGIRNWMGAEQEVGRHKKERFAGSYSQGTAVLQCRVRIGRGICARDWGGRTVSALFWKRNSWRNARPWAAQVEKTAAGKLWGTQEKSASVCGMVETLWLDSENREEVRRLNSWRRGKVKGYIEKDEIAMNPKGQQEAATRIARSHDHSRFQCCRRVLNGGGGGINPIS